MHPRAVGSVTFVQYFDKCLTLSAPSSCSVQNNKTFSVEEREGSYAKLVNAYYELATLFYEWGWGSSFHFASRWCGETFQESIKVRGEHGRLDGTRRLRLLVI